MPTPVEHPPGRDEVLNHTPIRSYPYAVDPTEVEVGQALGRNEPAPGDAAGVARLLLPK
jgi:hypothetical protein